MNEIFDEPVLKQQNKNTFSKLSFGFSLITLSLIVILFNKIPKTITPEQHFPIIPKWFIVMIHASCYLGLFFSIMSFVKKEKMKYFRVPGVVLNFVLFAILVGAIIFARVV